MEVLKTAGRAEMAQRMRSLGQPISVATSPRRHVGDKVCDAIVLRGRSLVQGIDEERERGGGGSPPGSVAIRM